MKKRTAVIAIAALVIVGVILTLVLLINSKKGKVSGQKTVENCQYDYNWSIEDKKLTFKITGSFEEGSWKCLDTETVLKLVNQEDKKNSSVFEFEYADYGIFDIRFEKTELETIILRVYCTEEGTIEVKEDRFVEYILDENGEVTNVIAEKNPVLEQTAEDFGDVSVPENGDYEAAVALTGGIGLPDGIDCTYAFAIEDEEEKCSEFGFKRDGNAYSYFVYPGNAYYAGVKKDAESVSEISELESNGIAVLLYIADEASGEAVTKVDGTSKRAYMAFWEKDGNSFALRSGLSGEAKDIFASTIDLLTK